MEEKIDELISQWKINNYSNCEYLIQKTKMVIRTLFPDDLELRDEYRNISTWNSAESWLNLQKESVSLLLVMQEQLGIQSDMKSPSDPFHDLSRIFDKFHNLTKQLRIRRKEKGKFRSTLNVKDEYDVQDLLHSLLHLFFDDKYTYTMGYPFFGPLAR
jgi:hypothetical protein